MEIGEAQNAKDLQRNMFQLATESIAYLTLKLHTTFGRSSHPQKKPNKTDLMASTVAIRAVVRSHRTIALRPTWRSQTDEPNISVTRDESLGGSTPLQINIERIGTPKPHKTTGL